jgi:hypothetical protein
MSEMPLSREYKSKPVVRTEVFNDGTANLVLDKVGQTFTLGYPGGLPREFSVAGSLSLATEIWDESQQELVRTAYVFPEGFGPGEAVVLTSRNSKPTEYEYIPETTDEWRAVFSSAPLMIGARSRRFNDAKIISLSTETVSYFNDPVTKDKANPIRIARDILDKKHDR